jgi:Fe-S cluster assembly ATP-binding protein
MDLTVRAGEVHAIMGPNGSGKSTFAKALAGHPAYTVTGGEVLFEGKDLFALAPEERSRAGVFLGFQYPVEIPGVSNSAFLRLGYNTVQGARGRDELDPLEFDDYVREKMKLLDMDPGFLDRSVNDGFSGGEKKRNEILQMAILEPKLAILDETDSGLDIDALRIVANSVNRLLTPDNAVVLVTHYQRLLNYIAPDFVHVMEGGRIIKTGGKELALERLRQPILTSKRCCRAAADCRTARRAGSMAAARRRWTAPTPFPCRPRATRSGVSPTSRRSPRSVSSRRKARRGSRSPTSNNSSCRRPRCGSPSSTASSLPPCLRWPACPPVCASPLFPRA